MTPYQFENLLPGVTIYNVPVNKLHTEVIKAFDECGYMTTFESGKQVYTSNIQRDFYLTVKEAVEDRMEYIERKIKSIQSDLDKWTGDKKKIEKISESV